MPKQTTKRFHKSAVSGVSNEIPERPQNNLLSPTASTNSTSRPYNRRNRAPSTSNRSGTASGSKDAASKVSGKGETEDVNLDQHRVGSLDEKTKREAGQDPSNETKGQPKPTKRSLDQLLQALQAPNSEEQRQQVLTILESNPSLMAAYFETSIEF